MTLLFLLSFLYNFNWLVRDLVDKRFLKKFSKLLTQNRLINRQNLALFHELKKRIGTWLWTPRLVYSERAFFFLQISEIKFLGKWNHERWQCQANVNITLKTGEKTWPLTEAQPNANYGRRQTFNYSVTFWDNIGPKCV